MLIRVGLFANLKDHSPTGDSRFEVELPEGASLADLFILLEIPDSVLRVSLVNGRDTAPDRILNNGDEVVLFPPVEGG